MTELNIPDEDCRFCGGTGEVTKMVHGRSGMVPCDSCKNVPESALPDEVPADPRARVDEIDGRLDALRREGEQYSELRSEVQRVRDGLDHLSSADLLSEEQRTRFSHIREQVGLVSRTMDRDRSVRARREQLREEQRKLETLIMHLETDADSEGGGGGE